jgi:hypothetical protein
MHVEFKNATRFGIRNYFIDNIGMSAATFLSEIAQEDNNIQEQEV